MSKSGTEKNTTHISRRISFVRNGEEWHFHNTVGCDVVLQLEYIGTDKVMEDESNTGLVYSMVRLEHLMNTCKKRDYWIYNSLYC